MIDAYRSLHPDAHNFSWWDYRGNGFGYNKGMRIDHLLLSPEAGNILTGADICVDLRKLDKPSDHAPVICELDLV